MKSLIFLKDSIAETKRLKKPSKKELFKFTYIVCVFCLISGAIIWLMDTFIRFVLQFILK